MMRRWLAILALTLAAPLTAAGPIAHGKWFDGPPPLRFQHLPARARLHTLATTDVQAACTRARPSPADVTIYACARNGVVTMPNPCEFPDERFAELLCHELAHINGWSGLHEF
jgi:hypothetical protein